MQIAHYLSELWKKQKGVFLWNTVYTVLYLEFLHFTSLRFANGFPSLKIWYCMGICIDIVPADKDLISWKPYYKQ